VDDRAGDHLPIGTVVRGTGFESRVAEEATSIKGASGPPSRAARPASRSHPVVNEPGRCPGSCRDVVGGDAVHRGVGPAGARPVPAARPAAAAPSPTALGASPEGRNGPVTVDADQLENLQKEGLAVSPATWWPARTAPRSTRTAWRSTSTTRAIASLRTVSTGNVRIITKDCRTGTAKRAEYYDDEQRVVLIGDARVWRDDNVVTGERITIFLARTAAWWRRPP